MAVDTDPVSPHGVIDERARLTECIAVIRRRPWFLVSPVGGGDELKRPPRRIAGQRIRIPVVDDIAETRFTLGDQHHAGLPAGTRSRIPDSLAVEGSSNGRAHILSTLAGERRRKVARGGTA